MEQLGSHWTDFHEILYFSIFRKPAEKIQVSLKSDNNGGILHEHLRTFVTVSRSVLLRLRNVLDRRRRENQNPHFVFNDSPPESRAVYEILWNKRVQPFRPQMTV
jgi:hypothetical protein